MTKSNKVLLDAPCSGLGVLSKVVISSICFAASRYSLPELLQVQSHFASKYGKKFVSAATKLAPDCSVNRQNGPIQFCNQCESKLPLPKEKHNEVDLHSSSHSGSIVDKDKPYTSFGSRTEANLDLQEVLATAGGEANAACSRGRGKS